MVRGSVAELCAAEGGTQVGSAKLATGDVLPCDVVVVGIGARPNTELCPGLKLDQRGFAVDGLMRTSDPDIFAFGDVCTFPLGGASARCEHVDHARKSAAQAVKAALGLAPEPYAYLPYFYSRLFEYTPEPIVFNFFGDHTGQMSVCPVEKGIGAIWVKDGAIVGALLMGSPGPNADDQAKLRELVAARPAPSEGDAAAAALAFAASKM